jgi:hypothetical protein
VFLAQRVIVMDVVWSSFAKAYFATTLLTTIGLAYRWLGRDAGIAAAYLITAQIVIFYQFRRIAQLCRRSGAPTAL